MNDCNPTDGHNDECRARSASRETGRTCSKAPNVAAPLRALPSPIGEEQQGAPEGYRYGDALQDVVQICRDATFEEAVAFLRVRFGSDRDAHAVRVLDAWAKKRGGSWAVDDFANAGGGALCVGANYLDELDSGEVKFEAKGETAAEARAAAAKALLEEDPTLGEDK